jgi:hypothetical protein
MHLVILKKRGVRSGEEETDDEIDKETRRSVRR